MNTKPDSQYQNWVQSLPKTQKEIEEKQQPYYRIYNETVLCERWPNTNCKKCLGKGYLHLTLPFNKKLTLRPNDLCACGSNKKFKKCCSDFINQNRNAHSKISPCNCTGYQSIFKITSDENLLEQVKEQLKV